jgi:hypothetical protein
MLFCKRYAVEFGGKTRMIFGKFFEDEQKRTDGSRVPIVVDLHGKGTDRPYLTM